MINVAQAWAEEYAKVNPEVSVQVAGGGSGVGIAGLTNGTVDLAISSRRMKEKELTRATQKTGKDPVVFTVGLDALAVYVHKDNPIESISVEQLAEIYGENGAILNWAQLGVANASCSSDEISRISRQNNSGTYYYFREAVVGKMREFKQGSIHQNGSKDVVALVSSTPCAIGYSGMAYGTPEVKMLSISKGGGDAVPPTKSNAKDGSYPIARPLFIYTAGEPTGVVKEYIDWIMSAEGQAIVDEIGYVSVDPDG
jgi:phosphate transport system substrate-binding protein